MIIPKNSSILIGAELVAVVLTITLMLTAGCAPEQRTSGEMRRSGEDAAAGAAGDPWAGAPSGPNVIRESVMGGDVLIVSLPDTLTGTPVTRYTLLRAPTMSWLVDHSFMWRTHPDDAGRHDVLIRADGPADTLFLSVLVE